MNKNIKGVIAVAILLIGGYCVYRKLHVPTAKKIDYLIKNNYSGGTPVALGAMQAEFIDAWYKGAKDLNATFVLTTNHIILLAVTQWYN